MAQPMDNMDHPDMVTGSQKAVILLFSTGFLVLYLFGLNTLSLHAVLVEPAAPTNQVTGVMAAQQNV